MKLITAIIKPFKLDDLRTALSELNIGGMTVTEIKGFGRQKGHAEVYHGAEYMVDFLPKYKIEILIQDNEMNHVIDVIIAATKSGKIGDGKIWVVNVEQVLRIRTGEVDEHAI
jgi:nitrogen regulatory protein PII